MKPETDNLEKGQLLQKSARHRELLEEEMRAITEKSEKLLTNALIIGGALALTYMLVSGLSRSKKGKSKGKKVKEGVLDEDNDETYSKQKRGAGVATQIGGLIAAQVTGYLLSIARTKLVEYLQSQTVKSDTDDHERS